MHDTNDNQGNVGVPCSGNELYMPWNDIYRGSTCLVMLAFRLK